MSNDNPNNDFHWRDKLDGLEHLPVGYFNKDTSWDRLHVRLGGKTNRKNLLWFWLAAACVVALLMVGLLNRYISRGATSKPEVATKQIRKVDLPVSIQGSSTVTTSQALTPVKSKKLHQTQPRSLVAIKAVIHTQEKPVNILQTAVIQKLQIIPPAPLAVTAVSPTRKLAVVHINELGDPEPESVDMARNKNRHSTKFKLGDQEVVATSSLAAKSTGFTIIKTKPSSN